MMRAPEIEPITRWVSRGADGWYKVREVNPDGSVRREYDRSPQHLSEDVQARASAQAVNKVNPWVQM